MKLFKCKYCREKKEAHELSSRLPQVCKSIDCIKKKYDEFKEKVHAKAKINLKKEKVTEKKELQQKFGIKYNKSNRLVLQDSINKIVRLIDKGHDCISEGTPLVDKFDAGHLFPVSGNVTLRYNLFNIHAQSVYGNKERMGNQAGYIIHLEKVFGAEYRDYVLSLPQLYPSIKISSKEVDEKIEICQWIVSVLIAETLRRRTDKPFSTQERLELREKYQKQIGFYN